MWLEFAAYHHTRPFHLTKSVTKQLSSNLLVYLFPPTPTLWPKLGV